MRKSIFSLDNMLILLAILFAMIRFIHIGIIPIFFDEAIYLSEADKITHDIRNLFIALQLLHYPVMTWILALTNLSTNNLVDLLTSGRVVSVLFDLASAYVVCLIGKKLYSLRLGILGSLIYLSLPLVFLHSRFAMLESPTNFFSLVMIYYTVCAMESSKKKNYLVIICFGLLAFFTKPLALVYFPAVFLLPLFFIKQKKEIIESFKKLLPFFVVLTLIIGVISLPFVRHFSAYNNLASSDSMALFFTLKTNLHRSWLWSNWYLTPGILSLVGTGGTLSFFQRKWQFVWLLVWIAGIVLLDSVVGGRFYPRHLYPLSAPVSLMVAYMFIELLKLNKALFVAIFILVFGILWQYNYTFLTTPVKKMVGEDRQQFYEDWSSGVGLDKVADKLNSLSKNKTIDVYVENEPLTAWALPNLYNLGKTRVHTLRNSIPNTKTPTYVVLNYNLELAKDWNVKKIASFSKGPNRSIEILKYISDK